MSHNIQHLITCEWGAMFNTYNLSELGLFNLL